MSLRLKRWRPQSFWAYVEQFGPFVGAYLLMHYAWHPFAVTAKRLDIAYELAGPLVSVMAIAVGFVAASLTILTTAVTQPVIRLRDNKIAYGKLIQYHAWATYVGVLACLTSLAILGRKHYDGNLDLWWLDQVWFQVNAWAGLTFIRVLVILVELLHPPEPPPTIPPHE